MKPTGQNVQSSSVGALRVYAAVLCFYLAAMIFNSEGLYRNASRLPYGNWRSVAMFLTEPLVATGQRMRVAGLRVWIEQKVDVYYEGENI